MIFERRVFRVGGPVEAVECLVEGGARLGQLAGDQPLRVGHGLFAHVDDLGLCLVFILLRQAGDRRIADRLQRYGLACDVERQAELLLDRDVVVLIAHGPSPAVCATSDGQHDGAGLPLQAGVRCPCMEGHNRRAEDVIGHLVRVVELLDLVECRLELFADEVLADGEGEGIAGRQEEIADAVEREGRQLSRQLERQRDRLDVASHHVLELLEREFIWQLRAHRSELGPQEAPDLVGDLLSLRRPWLFPVTR